MRMLSIVDGPEGVSRFEEREIEMSLTEFAPPAPAMPVSAVEPCRGLLHLVLPAGWTGARHPAPRRQVGYVLSGRIRVETGDGDMREAGPGAILGMMDVAGAGHVTSVLGDEDVAMAIVQLE